MQATETLKSKQICLMANGDLRLSANQKCWPEQARMETILTKALKAEGWKTVRAHPYDPAKRHGFIDSQKMGMKVFRKLDPDVPLIVAESVWQYSQHLLHGLFTHRGPERAGWFRFENFHSIPPFGRRHIRAAEVQLEAHVATWSIQKLRWVSLLCRCWLFGCRPQIHRTPGVMRHRFANLLDGMREKITPHIFVNESATRVLHCRSAGND